MKRIATTLAALALAAAATLTLTAPALACGNAPGLCPSPPGPWVTGTGGDF